MANEEPSNKATSALKRNIDTALEIAEEERRKKLQNQRLELARSGIAAYQAGKVVDAVRAFQTYIRILEEVKNVSEGELMPACFDFETELSELLMLSGVYWDLAKVYDRTRTPEKYRDFRHYLEKYIIFSKGMYYQELCAETLRIYLQRNKALHRSDFKNAYQVLKTSRCFIASSLVDVIDLETIPSLQDFRDQVLRTTPLGRAFICYYYRKSPKVAQIILHLPYGFRKILGVILDLLARQLQNN